MAPSTLLPSGPEMTLSVVLDAIDQAATSGERVQQAAVHLHALGFDRVLITVFDAARQAGRVVGVGASDEVSASGLPLKPLPGVVWRRLLPHLDRFQVGDLYQLDGRDPWVAREFFGCEPAPAGAAPGWLPTDLLIGVMRGPRREILGTVKLGSPRDGHAPEQARCEIIGAIVRHLGARLAHDALEQLARQRQERLQLLQEAGASMTRSLDEQVIVRELVRQVQRIVTADGAAILIPDLATQQLITVHHVVRGAEQLRPPVPLGEGLLAEVARTAESVRVGDRDADRAREQAGRSAPRSLKEIGGEYPVASAIVVPMRMGLRLLGVLAVHAASTDVFTGEDEEVLATMASQAATAIANARRYAESERERRTTEALAEVARAVGESLRLGEVLRLILRHTVSLLGVEGACIALREGDYLHLVAAHGSADVLTGMHLPLDASLMGRAVLTNEMMVLNTIGTQDGLNRTVRQLAQIDRAMMAPFITGRGTIGGIAVINRVQPFDSDDARVLQRLADQVSVAIVNARLFEEVERITRQWKLAFDNTASGIAVLEETLIISRCNARAAELCHTTIAALLGRNFGEALCPSASAPERTAIDRLLLRAMQERHLLRERVRDSASGRSYSLVIAPHPDGGCVITFDELAPVN